MLFFVPQHHLGPAAHHHEHHCAPLPRGARAPRRPPSAAVSRGPDSKEPRSTPQSEFFSVRRTIVWKIKTHYSRQYFPYKLTKTFKIVLKCICQEVLGRVGPFWPNRPQQDFSWKRQGAQKTNGRSERQRRKSGATGANAMIRAVGNKI